MIRRRLRNEAEAGAAMILAMGWGLLMLVLVLIVSNVVINQIRPSDRSEQSFAALSAAEAGLADLDARLQVGTLPAVLADESNLAFRSWVPVPGGDAVSEFTYGVDATKSGAVGEVRAYATGRAGGVTRTLEAVLSKRSTLDYVYMSDIESPSPDTPGIYGSNQRAAQTLCERRWTEPGPVKASSDGTVLSQGQQRNLMFCKWAGIFQGERIIGRVHTNDIWWLEERSLVDVLDPNSITSSCRSVDEGLEPGEVGCQPGHRYIGYSSSIPRDPSNTRVFPGNGSPTNYQGDTWQSVGSDVTQRNPDYDTILDLPASPDLLKQRAAESGCIYTGPTRIRFAEEGGQGFAYVTSPDTKLTRAGCDGEGGDGTRLQSAATSQYTARVRLDDFSDLVIYVQDVRPSTEVDVPGADYTTDQQKYYWEKANRWDAGTEPTCALKSGRKYPYVIPTDPVDQAKFASGSAYRGFPSEQADPDSPWYGSACASGDMYVEGSYRGSLMLASENNVILTSSLQDSRLANAAAAAGAADYGQPAADSTSTLGVAAGRFAYVYRPITSANAWVGDWRVANANNPIFNFALLAIQHCFGTQDYSVGPNNGYIYLWGSIAQKFRCAVGLSGGSGYGKKYKYDDRLTTRTPPYMLELSDEPWGDERTGEITPVGQAVGETRTWDLLRTGEAGALVRRVALASSPDAAQTVWSASGTEVTVSSGLPGLVVFVYEVDTGSGWEVRRQVILVQ